MGLSIEGATASFEVRNIVRVGAAVREFLQIYLFWSIEGKGRGKCLKSCCEGESCFLVGKFRAFNQIVASSRLDLGW